jgi:hypothetical protein
MYHVCIEALSCKERAENPAVSVAELLARQTVGLDGKEWLAGMVSKPVVSSFSTNERLYLGMPRCRKL